MQPTLTRKMRLVVPALIVALLVSCVPPRAFDAASCIAPPTPGSIEAGSLTSLVDRADLIAAVRVANAERSYAPYYDGLGARRLTLDVIDRAKGSVPDRFVVEDGPCPVIAAMPGEAFVVFLEPTPDGGGPKLIGFPTSAVRATSGRSLPQLMSEIRAIEPLDDDARALFERHGWNVTAKHDFGEFQLPPLSEFAGAAREIRGAAPHIWVRPLATYADLSSEVGLDLRAAAGRTVERLSFWLERKPPEFMEGTPFGHVLISDRRIVAAWVTTFATEQLFSVRARDAALAAPSVRPSFPPANRFPEGVNVARLYGLARASEISYKTSNGATGSITDPAHLAAIVAAMDQTLPTEQAIWDQRQPLGTTYYLHFRFEGSSVPLQYAVEEGLVTVAADGLAVRPGPALAAALRSAAPH